MNRPTTSPPQSDNVPITMIPRPNATCKCAPSHRVCDEFLQWVPHSLRFYRKGWVPTARSRPRRGTRQRRDRAHFLTK